MNIDDPLSKIYGDVAPVEKFVRNPVTGIREPIEKLQREASREEEKKRKIAVARRVINGCMQDPLFREWVYDLLVKCNLFGNPYGPTDRDTALNCGALFVGRALEREIKTHALGHYQVMIAEGFERDQMWDDEAADK